MILITGISVNKLNDNSGINTLRKPRVSLPLCGEQESGKWQIHAEFFLTAEERIYQGLSKNARTFLISDARLLVKEWSVFQTS